MDKGEHERIKLKFFDYDMKSKKFVRGACVSAVGTIALVNLSSMIPGYAGDYLAIVSFALGSAVSMFCAINADINSDYAKSTEMMVNNRMNTR